MWPFKKHLPIDDLNEDGDLWSVMEAPATDGSMLVRINTTAKRWAKHPSLGIRVGFAIPLNQPSPGGVPDAFENFALNQMENKILSYLKSSGPAIHVLSITTGTFKEFVFYIKNGDSVASIHEKLRSETTSHDVQCMAVHDPKWAVYASFSK
ncbi:DUF695 domain-containing protein [Massilia pinisoli]|uniref:DUF695 domain-containing protein n=1 Tax=Massilia pinisoli TaxID=1772194 RepID=A0ABT2A044_9BURK|nr:DUF695 domain-containing protein [Massilia pinisoli]MCS0585551.1 DUF695 domain-containing protein [Massilia pinisoli]